MILNNFQNAQKKCNIVKTKSDFYLAEDNKLKKKRKEKLKGSIKCIQARNLACFNDIMFRTGVHKYRIIFRI